MWQNEGNITDKQYEENRITQWIPYSAYYSPISQIIFTMKRNEWERERKRLYKNVHTDRTKTKWIKENMWFITTNELPFMPRQTASNETIEINIFVMHSRMYWARLLFYARRHICNGFLILSAGHYLCSCHCHNHRFNWIHRERDGDRECIVSF